MTITAQEKKRREEIEREWKAAEALYHERCAVVYNHTDIQRKAATRLGTDKAAAAQREFVEERGEVERRREQQRKQLERAFVADIDSLSADKHRVCLDIEEEIVQQLRVIKDEEQKTLAPLEAEREVAHQRYRSLLDPPEVPVAPVVPVVPAESETKHDE